MWVVVLVAYFWLRVGVVVEFWVAGDCGLGYLRLVWLDFVLGAWYYSLVRGWYNIKLLQLTGFWGWGFGFDELGFWLITCVGVWLVLCFCWVLFWTWVLACWF